MRRDSSRFRSRLEFPFHSRLFIGNFDHSAVTQNEVESIFSKYGVLQQKATIRKGYCFVQYADEETATRALNGENGRVLGTKKIEIQYAKVSDRSRVGFKRKRFEHSSYDHASKKYKTSHTVPGPSSGTVSVTPRVPLFVFGYNLINYSNIVEQQFLAVGITADAHFVGNEFMKSVPNEKYLIYIFPRNALNSTICFCSVTESGRSGFVDTPLMNVVKFCQAGLVGVTSSQISAPTAQTVPTSGYNYNVNYSFQAPPQQATQQIQLQTSSFPQQQQQQLPQVSTSPFSNSSLSQVKDSAPPSNSGLKGLLNRLSSIQTK